MNTLFNNSNFLIIIKEQLTKTELQTIFNIVKQNILNCLHGYIHENFIEYIQKYGVNTRRKQLKDLEMILLLFILLYQMVKNMTNGEEFKGER